MVYNKTETKEGISNDGNKSKALSELHFSNLKLNDVMTIFTIFYSDMNMDFETFAKLSNKDKLDTYAIDMEVCTF